MSGCLAACLLFLTACSKDAHITLSETETDTLYVSANGNLELANVEEFSSEQYKEGELKTFIEETIQTFKADGKHREDSVAMKDFVVKNKEAKVLLAIENAETYTAFQGEELQFLTSDNITDNLILPENFKTASDGKTIEKKTVLEEKGLKYLIIEENLCVKVEGTIKYYSDAMLTGDNEIQTTGEKVAVIIFE